jgi:hypothetical protein
MEDGDQTFSSSGQFGNAEIPIESGLSENVLLAVSKRRLSECLQNTSLSG